MRLLFFLIGLICCLGVFLDAFQTVILPRRPKARVRITRLFFLLTWRPWTMLLDRLPRKSVRDQVASIFGPLSLLLLLVVWASLLVIGFGLLYFALGTPFHDGLNPPVNILARLKTDLYVSGTSLFTLGLGDVTPTTLTARFLLVLESGTGLGFVALVIGYVPVLYQAFSRREVSVALLDSRAGSPPTAAELLNRHSYDGGEAGLIELLAEWERWSAEVLESHVSYPILTYYRSQHDNQNWLSALMAVLDCCALLIATGEGAPLRQAQLTFAVARHAVIDIGQIFKLVTQQNYCTEAAGRLDGDGFRQLCGELDGTHLRLCGDECAQQRLSDLRGLYEPQAMAIARYLRLDPPLWVPPAATKKDSWRTVADHANPSGGPIGAGHHVSSRSTASNLDDEDHRF